MKHYSRLIVVVIVLAVLLGGLFSWKMLQLRQQQTQMNQPPPPALVETTTVAIDSWPQTLTAIGSLRAVNGIRVANEIAGIVESIAFESGQQVKAGDELLRLNADTDSAALDTLKAEQRLAEQQFKRFANLVRERAVSQSDFDEAKANLEAAEARVHQQQATLVKKMIRAPFAGLVGLRLVDLGQFLEVGTPIVQIGTLDPIYVDFTISERYLPLVKVGDRVDVKVAAYPRQVFSGAVLALDTTVNTGSRTLQVRASLVNPDLKLRPGMFANVTSYQGLSEDVLILPRTAISYNTYGEFVYVIQPGQGGSLTVERRSVTTGQVRDGRVAVVTGVAAGEQVVAAGLLRLRNGQSVSISNSEALHGGGAGS